MSLRITEYCLHCSACRAWCPYGAIRIRGSELEIDREICDECGRCVAACPNEAIVPAC